MLRSETDICQTRALLKNQKWPLQKVTPLMEEACAKVFSPLQIFGRYFLVVVYPEGVINQLACSFEIPKDAIIRGYIAQR